MSVLESPAGSEQNKKKKSRSHFSDWLSHFLSEFVVWASTAWTLFCIKKREKSSSHFCLHSSLLNQQWLCLVPSLFYKTLFSHPPLNCTDSTYVTNLVLPRPFQVWQAAAYLRRISPCNQNPHLLQTPGLYHHGQQTRTLDKQGKAEKERKGLSLPPRQRSYCAPFVECTAVRWFLFDL